MTHDNGVIGRTGKGISLVNGGFRLLPRRFMPWQSCLTNRDALDLRDGEEKSNPRSFLELHM